jgi:hypothetical protein
MPLIVSRALLVQACLRCPAQVLGCLSYCAAA